MAEQDLSRPYVGYRSAGRRPESQQDRTASANAPLSALRGYVAGTLGLPGDIEGLGRMLIPGVSEQSYLPDSEYFRKVLPMRELEQTPIGSAFTEAGGLAGGAGLMTAGKVAGKGAMAAGRAGERVAEKYVPQIMERGGLGADILSGMAEGSRSQIFIGPNAKTFNKAKANTAVDLEKAGVDPADIWRQTGTFRGADGILRQEINDRAAKFLSVDERQERIDATKGKIAEMKEKIKPTPQKDLFPKALTEAKKEMRDDISILRGDVKGREKNPRTQGLQAQHILEHPELYKAYPELQNVNIVTEGGSGNTSGSLSIMPSRGFYPGSMEMDIYDKGLRSNPTSIALHEMQHAVQTLEGMGPGGNPTFAFANPEAHEILKKLREETYKPSTFEQFQRVNKFPEDEAQAAYEQYLKERKANPITSDKVERAMQETAAMEYYKRLLGEAEARAVQDRQLMTPAQRMETFPPTSYDVPREDLIIKPPREYAQGGPVSLNQLAARYDKGGEVDQDTLDTFVAPRYRKQRATPSSKETKEAMAEVAKFGAEMLIPQTPFDAGLMLIPGGRLARKAGAALIALDAGDAQASPLAKLLKAFHGASRPIEGTYDVSKASERSIMGKGLNVSTDPAYPSRWAMHPGSLAPTVYETAVPVDKYIQLDATYPQEAFDVLRKVRGRNPLPEGEVTGEQVYQSLRGLPQSMIPDVVLKSGYKGVEYPAQDKGRWFSIYDTEGVKDRLGKKFADGGPVSLDQLAAHYDKGGAVKAGIKKIISLFDDGEEALTAAQRAEAGRKAAELIKAQEQVKASEALGQLMERGTKRTTTTQSDRTRVGGGNIGGAAFPAISQADPAYAGRVWGVMDEGTAARLKNLTDPDTAWTTMLGAANQLKSNPIVFDKLKRGFLDSMKKGNLSDELAGKINHNLALTFGEGADIRNPKIWREADTFEKRGALADVMMGQGIAPGKGGVALGGEKSGKGVIFKPTDILKRETEPSLLHSEYGGGVPTYAAGPRLFKIGKESEYRPDLHPGFPTLLRGEDLGVNMMPTPTEVYLPDWHAKFKKANPDRAPGYYDLSLGVKGEGLPSQEINDAYIRHLMREGYAEGGSVNSPATYDPSLIDEIVSSIDEPTGYAGGGIVKGLAKLGKKMVADSAPTAPRSVSAGDVVNGMMVRKDIPNTSSIGASLSDYSTHGLQEVPMSAFETVGKPRYRSVQEEKYTKELARQIQENKELNPLIVVKDAEGHYILEGGHRFDALRELGIDSFPALMVHDLESLGKKLPVPPVAKARGGSVRMAQGGSVSAYDADRVDAIANQFM